jgi:transcriptional regulator with XRE-family HTH domain
VLTELTDLLAHTTGATCDRCANGQTGSHPHNAPARIFRPTNRADGPPAPAVVVLLRSSLGAELRRLRAEFGLSQGQLASRAGSARSTVERLEAGQCRPTASMLASFVVAAGWAAPGRPAVAHEHQVLWLQRLLGAAGEHLVVDTASGLRRRARRLGDGRRAWAWQQAVRAREMAAAEAARRRALLADVRALSRATTVSAILRVASRIGW